ncbi:MAG: DUF1844 domain-containing protein [archaeon]
MYDPEFIQLVIGLQSSAWMLLGKVANPMTGKTECSLEAAKATIDTLLMLKEKTRGNLSKDEEDLLSNAIQQLEINYVEETKKPQPKESDHQKESPKGQENPAGEEKEKK